MLGVVSARAQEEEEEPELWMAAAQGDVATVQRLVESGAEVAWEDTFGSTALHCACTNGHVVCARLLITARASVDQTNKNGATALHVACCDGHAECVELLLAAQAAWPDLTRLLCNQPDKNGATALHQASAHGHVRCVALLVEDTDLRRKCLGKSALEWAREKGHATCSALLQEAETRRAAAREVMEASELKARAKAADAAMASLLAEGAQEEERLCARKAARRRIHNQSPTQRGP